MELEFLHGGKPWVADVDHWNYRAATKATEVRWCRSIARLRITAHSFLTATILSKIIYKVTPDLTREGGSIPVTLTFAEALGVNVLLLPMGRGDDGAQCVVIL